MAALLPALERSPNEGIKTQQAHTHTPNSRVREDFNYFPPVLMLLCTLEWFLVLVGVPSVCSGGDDDLRFPFCWVLFFRRSKFWTTRSMRPEIEVERARNGIGFSVPYSTFSERKIAPPAFYRNTHTPMRQYVDIRCVRLYKFAINRKLLSTGGTLKCADPYTRRSRGA